MEDKLNILWTNSDPITAEKMVLMYAPTSITKGWWREVTVIIWGGSTQMITEHAMIQEKIKMAIHQGVKFVACKACAQQLGAIEVLEELGVEVKYMGLGLTEIIKDKENLITI